MAAPTNYYVDPSIAADTGTGTIGDPFGDLQYGLNTVSRDGTNGDQFNIKAGTAEVLAAPLTLVTYGTPTVLAPLIIRGYTATANDGGVGEISCGGGGFAAFSSTTIPIIFVDVKVGNSTVPSTILTVGPYSQLLRVEAHTALSAFYCYANSVVAGCYTHDLTQSAVFAAGAGVSIWGNYLLANAYGVVAQYNHYAVHVLNNIIVMTGGGSAGVQLPRDGICLGNIIHSTIAHTGNGILLTDSRAGCVVGNNIISGFSGAGGEGLIIDANDGSIVTAANAYYNNTTNESIGCTNINLADPVALAADPFVDAANGNFMLTDAAKAALRSAGWPCGYLGASASLDPHITIGPVQYGPAVVGGAVSISPARGGMIG